MGTTIQRTDKRSPILPDEHLVHEEQGFRVFSYRSRPSFGYGLNLPLLSRTSLLVTDIRCLLVYPLLLGRSRLLSMWYPGRNPEGDPETIIGICSTKGLFGSCLEIRSHNPERQKGWYWSPDQTLRFFLKRPQLVEAAILEQMGQVESANKPDAGDSQ